MKTKLLLAFAFLNAICLSAQTDGWYLLTRPGAINSIIPDDTNSNELHLSTDIGYIKYNTSTSMVTDFLNLTSQNPAIGHVNNITLNPTNNDIAMTLDNGFAIYDGANTTIYNYDNSNLTLGETASQFTFLQAEYAKNGTLYLFKEDVFGYQIFDNGSFETEVTTSFRTKDIVENNAGTKVYFAGWNNGLWQLEKATTTWTNYTSSNSDLIYNGLQALYVDPNDLLYIGGFQGLNTLTSGGVWNTYQQLAPPANVSFYPVYDISRNGAAGDVLIRTSGLNTSYFGFTLLDLATNTWTNYRGDGTNCVDNNVVTASAMDSNGSIFVAPQDTFNPGFLTNFDPFTDACVQLNINYLDSPYVANSYVISDIDIIHPSDTIFIGMTKGQRMSVLGLHENDASAFTGSFANTIEITPSPGNQAYGIMNQNGKFLVENNNGWVSVDENYNTMSFAHNIPNYLALASKNAAGYTNNNNSITIVHKGFDASFNYRMYKTQCDLNAGTCSTPEELFTTDRDLANNILVGVSGDIETGTILATAVKTNIAGDINRVRVSWDGATNGTPITNYDEFHGAAYPVADPISILDNDTILDLFHDTGTSITVRLDGGAITNQTFDQNNDGNPDKIYTMGSSEISESESRFIITWMFVTFGATQTPSVNLTLNQVFNGTSQTNKIQGNKQENTSGIDLIEIPDGALKNNLPKDLFITKVKFKQYSPTEALIVMLTNYGLLIKTGIDITGLTLGTKDFSLTENDIQLYPNPAIDMVSFSDNYIKTIEVYDINGRNVLSAKGSTLSVKSLSQGLYIVKGMTSENNSVSKKLIKN